jgi:type I restriction enzyme R subunit
MPHAYTEDQLVEQPAIGLFAELGWQTVSALEETVSAPSPGLAATLSHPMGEGASLGRETKGEVVLVVPLARGVGAAQSRAAARGHHRRRG